MAEIDAPWVLRELRETLGRLAQDGYAQRGYLHSLGAGVDELALEFDAVAPVAPALAERKMISPEQAVAIRAVQERLKEMSGTANAAHWTEEALDSSAAWADVRRLASAALDLLRDA
jgi:hypothetical protein